MRGIERTHGQDTTQTPAIWSSLALLSADRLLSFEGEARLKASHGIRDRTSKGKARFQSLLGKRAPTGSDTPISWMKANVFYWNRGMCRSIPLFTLPSRDSLPWVRIRSWKRMTVYQFIFIKGQGPREAQSKRKRLLLLIDLVGRDQRIKGFVPALEGKEKRIHLSFIRYWLKLPEKANLKELSFDQTWLCESGSPDSALTSQPHSLAKTRTRLL